MSCRFSERVEALVDGEPDALAERLTLEHLLGCEACREERRQLEALLARAAALPRELEPGRELWPGIRARLSVPARVLGFRPRAEARPRPRRPMGLLAAAAALVAVSSAGTALLMRPEPSRDPHQLLAVSTETNPLLRAERDYERAAGELIAALDERRDLLAPETREAVEQSLKVVDGALADLRRALGTDPGNRELARLFNATHRKRVELLRGAVRLSQS